MKKIIIILVILHASFFTVQPAAAQWGCSCLPEGIDFYTQEQIDSFQVNYPGCKVIKGDVMICDGCDGSIDIKNLNGLNILTSIEGDLEFPCNDSLTTLTGLEGLTMIGGSLRIGCSENWPSRWKHQDYR
jgi:hypothetical protein